MMYRIKEITEKTAMYSKCTARYLELRTVLWMFLTFETTLETKLNSTSQFHSMRVDQHNYLKISFFKMLEAKNRWR